MDTQTFDEMLNQKISSELTAYLTRYGILLDLQIEAIADKIIESIQSKTYTESL